MHTVGKGPKADITSDSAKKFLKTLFTIMKKTIVTSMTAIRLQTNATMRICTVLNQ